MNLIQLTLTEKEALILGSITALGIKTYSDNKEGIEYTKSLLDIAMTMWPKETESLAEKMIVLNDTTRKLHKRELEDARTLESS